ncbi:TAXI family TRAP transporter solute-binding subunit [Gammaproteobacteria bacterium]|nr:TAXI family TRAP transporter solute-binding subunit [Gammaproteobacteria bacterium]
MTAKNQCLAGILLMIAMFSAVAQEVDLRLCTASAIGNYYASGQEISRQVKLFGITVELMETDGSMDNLKKMAANECDAGIVQIDAYLVYQEAHKDERLDIRRPQHLYDEFLHLVCRTDSGIDSIEDLADQAESHTLLVGPPQSGSAVTWQSLALMDASYSEVKTGEQGGKNALELVQDAQASCLIFVSGLRSEYSSMINQSGSQLKLVTIDDSDLSKATFAGHPIYTFKDISAETYPNLQAGGAVESLFVRAIFIVNSAWAEAFPSAFNVLFDGVERATPVIQQRVSVR